LLVSRYGMLEDDVSHEELHPGARFAGPAIVQSGEFSALIGPRQNCVVDDYRNLLIAF
jgi:hypothetical protein